MRNFMEVFQTKINWMTLYSLNDFMNYKFNKKYDQIVQPFSKKKKIYNFKNRIFLLLLLKFERNYSLIITI